MRAFDELDQGGVAVRMSTAPIVAAFATSADARPFVQELEHLERLGGGLDFTELTGTDASQASPLLSSAIEHSLVLNGQRSIDPGATVEALAVAIRERGASIYDGADVSSAKIEEGSLVVRTRTGGPILEPDAVLLASGAWLTDLGRGAGIRTPVQSGRGYSFTVDMNNVVTSPVYLPSARAVCTPYRGRLRVAGTMEFREPSAPLDPRRIEAISRSVEPWLQGIDWSTRTADWVGPRPVTPDGLPLIGQTSVPGIYAAGGHGMWGVTLGPATGKAIAEIIATGKSSTDLSAFDPCRR